MLLKIARSVLVFSLLALLSACGVSTSTEEDGDNSIYVESDVRLYINKDTNSTTFTVPDGYVQYSNPRFGTLHYNESNNVYTYVAGVPSGTFDEVLFNEDSDSHGVHAKARTSHQAIAITFSNPNVAPVARHGVGTLMQDTPTLIELNATDMDGDILSYAVSYVSHGSTTDCSLGICTFTPDAGYYGSAYLEFRAFDGQLYSEAKTFNLAVYEQIRPYALQKETVVEENSSVSIVLEGYDFNSLPLSFSIFSAPSSGTLTGTGANVIYTPNSSFVGVDSFQFRVYNGSQYSLPGTVHIKIKAIPRPWVKIESTSTHTAAIKDDGTLWLWGFNSQGQLGDGASPVSRWEPWRLGSEAWSDVSTGDLYTLAIKADGTLWAWGYNQAGYLGLGDTIPRNVPVQVGTDSNWIKVAAARNHAFAIKNNGTLWAWGSNGAGALGLGNSGSPVLIPTQVGTDSWSDISAGDTFFSIGIKSDGTLWGWGSHTSGEVGAGATPPYLYTSPVQIDAGSWKSISAGESHTLAIKSDDTLWAWGRATSGQLGFLGFISRIVPTKVGSDTWQSVSASDRTSIGINTSGKLFRWGRMYTTDASSSTIQRLPLQMGTDNWKTVSRDHAIKSDDTLWGWWRNNNGQLGNGTNVFQVDPIEIN